MLINKPHAPHHSWYADILQNLDRSIKTISDYILTGIVNKMLLYQNNIKIKLIGEVKKTTSFEEFVSYLSNINNALNNIYSLIMSGGNRKKSKKSRKSRKNNIK